MTMCPKGCGRPSRYEPSYRGMTPLCQACAEASKSLHYKQSYARRKGYLAPTAPLPPTYQPPRARVYVDLTPEQIERKFQAALKRIKARGLPR